MQNGEHYPPSRHFNPQVSMIQEIPDDVETLKSMYMQSVQEIKVMHKKLQGNDQELQMQKKSLSNLALTVVQQDKHIKNLLQHIEQLKGAQGGGGGGYMDRQQNSMSGISDGAYSAGDVHSQSSGEEEDEYYEDVTGGQAEDEEMYQLKQQILNAHDFLKDLDVGEGGDNSPPVNDGGKRNRRGSRINSRTSSPYSQKSLGMSDLASNFQQVNSKPPTPPASSRSRGENHRRSTTNDNIYADEENSRINRSRSIQPRATSRQQYSSGGGVNRMQSIDSFQDETSSIMSRVEDRVRRQNQGSEGRSYSKNGSSTYREQTRYNVDEDYAPPSSRRTSLQKQYRDYGGGGSSIESRRTVGRLSNRLDSGYSYTGSYGTKATSNRTDSYQLSNGSKRTGSGIDDEFDVGALKDKIAALESEGWENDNYLD
eukprot:TRINITY_DN21002_c0_g2_i4.p1 TRINITY_DN21002_c0_g2~~TRINITY_DN21002_c0_g2_i4.p1  ORF type:complete len:426 (+),score=73.91 TRINITY_DN21002_c0_g2_i4:135-1412(+)